MDIDLEQLNDAQRYKLLMSSVVPRPIALVTTVCECGIVNAAPFSLFNVIAASPPTVVVSIDTRRSGAPKDTGANILSTGEFVINLVNEQMAEQMNVCAADIPSEEDELQLAGFATAPAKRVTPPLITQSPISLECKMAGNVDIGNHRTVVIGKILHFHIKDEFYVPEKGYVLAEKMQLIARMHGRGWYSRTTDLFQLERPDPERYR